MLPASIGPLASGGHEARHTNPPPASASPRVPDEARRRAGSPPGRPGLHAAPLGRRRWVPRLLAGKLELHHTPKHGSWLNIAELELSVLGRQCLNRRMPDKPTLAAEVAAWAERRNAARGTVDWRFTADDARIKLKRLYPKIQE